MSGLLIPPMCSAGCGSRSLSAAHSKSRQLLAAAASCAQHRSSHRLLCTSSSTADKAAVKAGKGTNLADREGSPFHELGLKDVTEGMGRVRVRQHVNPLASQFQQPTPAIDWHKVYKDPSLPLFVDMGCGPGRFLLLLSRKHQEQQQQMNYLGLEIRQPLVERANKWAQELGKADQVHYVFTNVSISLAGLLQSYAGHVATLSAQFPDPHFKKRHKKRRMVQQSVVDAARELLMPGGQIFLQSDVYDAVVAMRDEFEQYAGDVLQLHPLHSTAPVFQWTREQEVAETAAAAAAKQQPSSSSSSSTDDQQQIQQELGVHQGSESEHSSSSGIVGADEQQESEQFVSTWAAGGWLVDNPLGVPTEREHYVQAQGGKVFRVLLVKKQ